MMTSSNDNKSDICQFFFSRLIPYCQYNICTKFHVNWTKFSEIYTTFFLYRGPTNPPPPPPSPEIFKNPSPGRVNKLGILLKYRKPLKNFLQPASLLKILVFHNFFFKVFWQLYIKNISFLTNTKICLLCSLLWIQIYQINW